MKELQNNIMEIIPDKTTPLNSINKTRRKQILSAIKNNSLNNNLKTNDDSKPFLL